MKKIAIILLLTYSAIAMSSTESTIKAELGQRHQVSGWNSSFPRHIQNFEHYVNHYRDIIGKTRTDLSGPNRQRVITGNAPFQLEPATGCKKTTAGKYQRGIVLGHGLTDSGYQLHHFARHFQQQCFYVMVILLPGHGTRPGDMLDMQWKSWVAAMDFAMDQIATKVDEMYVGGFSAGGTLALFQASNDNRVRGVFTFSPAVKISSLSMFAGFIDWLGRIYEPIRWMKIMPDKDSFKYESFPHNAAWQMYQLIKVMGESIAENGITVPVFTVASAQDSTIDVEATVDLIKSLKNEKNKMLLYSQYQRSEPAPIKVVSSHFPEKGQLSLAHTGLSIPIEDPHYGENGAYRNCSHYYDENSENYLSCKQDEVIFVGETTQENLKQGIMRRATYNFLYREMLVELDNFINSL